MALISCPECSHQVSRQAGACPNCGRPFPPASAHGKRTVPMPRRGYICESCGEVGWPKSVVKGSFLIEILLWLCFIVPGLIYTIWRLTSRVKECPECSGHMIPVTTPRARALAQQLHPNVIIR